MKAIDSTERRRASSSPLQLSRTIMRAMIAAPPAAMPCKVRNTNSWMPLLQNANSALQPINNTRESVSGRRRPKRSAAAPQNNTGSAAPITNRDMESSVARRVIISSCITVGKEGKYTVVAICAIKTSRQASVMVLAGTLHKPLCFTHIALLILPPAWIALYLGQVYWAFRPPANDKNA
ncbi:hypothetical protein D3C79_845610 [compost metagenome]